MDIWASEDLKRDWEEMISQKAVTFFEKYVTAKCAQNFKSKNNHAFDTGIPLKYIERSVKFLEQVGLLRWDQESDLFCVQFYLPITKQPPKEVARPLWASDKRKSLTIPQTLKKEIYRLDAETCSYCEKHVDYSECKIDHIYPDSKGGADSIENMTVACDTCNREKWSWILEDKEYVYPKRFRGKTVDSVEFEKVAGYFVPKFIFGEDENE